MEQETVLKCTIKDSIVLEGAYELPGDLVKMLILILRAGWGLRFCIPNKVQRGAGALGPRIIIWAKRICPGSLG